MLGGRESQRGLEKAGCCCINEQCSSFKGECRVREGGGRNAKLVLVSLAAAPNKFLLPFLSSLVIITGTKLPLKMSTPTLLLAAGQCFLSQLSLLWRERQEGE